MTWDQVGLFATSITGLALLLRLARLRECQAYRVLRYYVAYQIVISLVIAATTAIPAWDRFYEFSFPIILALGWVFTLWLVYAILDGILENLPGILNLSRWLLHVTFLTAALIGLLTSGLELASHDPLRSVDYLDLVANVCTIIERVVSTVAFLVTLAIMCFVLWFPVELPRNYLRLPSVFLVYLFAKVALFFSRVYLPGDVWQFSGSFDLALTSLSYISWYLLLSPAGDIAPVRIGHRWHVVEQDRLLQNLNALNKVLVTGLKQ